VHPRIDEAIRCKLAGEPVGERFVAIITSARSDGAFTGGSRAGLLHVNKVGSVRQARKAADDHRDLRLLRDVGDAADALTALLGRQPGAARLTGPYKARTSAASS
jgi:hypothetical protein